MYDRVLQLDIELEGAKRTTRRGFASMDPKRVRAIASMGGRSAPRKNGSFRPTGRWRMQRAVKGRRTSVAMRP
ncbi:KGG domain-containing protein [Camelimonas sp. ID_303_24]